MSSNSSNVQIGDNNFAFNVFLNNGSVRTGISFSSIEEFDIVDDLRQFFVYGTLSFNYNEEALEGFEQNIGNIQGLSKNITPYVFRGDGRDILEIEIMPQIKDSEPLESKPSESEKRKYCIKHVCSVYKYEDITEGEGQKIRKLYFWDRDYQILNEVNLDLATGDKTRKIKPISNSNEENSISTGDALEYTLKKSLVDVAGLKFSKGKWEKGETTILYSSPSNAKAIDDITNILKDHISDRSNNYVPCILKKERYTEKYNLIPINHYYKSTSNISNVTGKGNFLSMGPGVVEDFFIGKANLGDDDFSFSHPKRKNQGNMNMTDYNLINDYTFNKIDAEELQKHFTSTASHGVDPRGFFHVDLGTNSTKSMEKVYNETFVKNSGSIGSTPSSILPSNSLRTDNRNTVHNLNPYNVNEHQPKSNGVSKSMKELFFKNTSITFRARGNTLRQTGQFFTINRTDNSSSSSKDNNILGKYLITYLRHEFKRGNYTNTIHGVKPYVDEKQNFAPSI